MLPLPNMAPGVATDESPGSKRGQAYIAAGHERIPNMGQQVLDVVTSEGYETQALFQIAEVTRPLTAVGSTCDRGDVVIYGPHGGCVVCPELGKRNPDGLHPTRGHIRIGLLDANLPEWNQ